MRVLVTRPPEQAERTAARLTGRGRVPVVAPIVRIVATDAPTPAGPFDFVVATSANAIEHLRADALPRMRDLPLYPIGGRTFHSACARGFSSVCAATPDIAAFSATLPRLPRGRWLYLAGRERKPALEQAMGAQALVCSTLVVYTAEAEPQLPVVAANALRNRSLDASLIYSHRSCDALFRLTTDAGLAARLLAVPQVCLSADAAEPARHAGARTIIAAEPTEAALFDALDSL